MGEQHRKISPLKCVVHGCEGRQRSLRMCDFHYLRHHRGLPLDMPRHEKLHYGEQRKLHHGYVIVTHQGKDREEHRVVVEEWLGRPLLRSEVIHHINGLRDDNRLSNLEIHSRGSHRALHNREANPPSYCPIQGCPHLVNVRGYCHKHYWQVKNGKIPGFKLLGVKTAKSIVKEIKG